MGVFVLMISIQLLLRRSRCWVPRWLQKRYIKPNKVQLFIQLLRPPARFIDRWLRPCLTWFIHGAGLYVIAIVCFLLATTLPMMELIPLSAHGAGAALTAFGLALIAHDGLLALIAFTITALAFGLAVYTML